MKKLQLNGLQPLTKEQMKSISGGMYCTVDDQCPTNYRCDQFQLACITTVYCSNTQQTVDCADCFAFSNPCDMTGQFCQVLGPYGCF